MIKEKMIEFVNIVKNDAIDPKTGKRISQNKLDDIMEFFDDHAKCEGGSEIVFDPESYGLSKDATPEEIVERALRDE